jgi:hypothetical protein
MAPPLTGRSLIRIRQPKERLHETHPLFAAYRHLPFGSVLADAPKSKNAKVTLVYQHELPNVPGKSIKGVLVECSPGGYSPGHTHLKSAFIYATVLKGGDPQSGQRRTGDHLRGRTELLRAARRPPRRQRHCRRDEAGQAPRGVCGGHERDRTDDPIRKLRFNTFHAEILRREENAGRQCTCRCPRKNPICLAFLTL